MQQQLSRDWLTDITEHAPIVIHLKQAVSIERTKFAHPIVSEEYLDRFLNIGARSQNLTDLELRLFHYLRTMSITPANIQDEKRSLARPSRPLLFFIPLCRCRHDNSWRGSGLVHATVKHLII